MKRFDLAYNAYEYASTIADKYESQKRYKPAAIRGMGVILIEQGKLDEAELKFKKSLVLEPDNTTALNELECINHLRKKVKAITHKD